MQLGHAKAVQYLLGSRVKVTSSCGAVSFQDQLHCCVHRTGCVLHQGEVSMILSVLDAIIQIQSKSGCEM